MTDVYTMNLSDNGDGMVNLNNNQSTNFIPNDSGPSQIPQMPPIQQQQQQQMPSFMTEKNVSENKQTMDSTPINEIIGQPEAPLEPPMMAQDPRMLRRHQVKSSSLSL